MHQTHSRITGIMIYLCLSLSFPFVLALDFANNKCNIKYNEENVKLRLKSLGVIIGPLIRLSGNNNNNVLLGKCTYYLSLLSLDDLDYYYYFSPQPWLGTPWENNLVLIAYMAFIKTTKKASFQSY